MKEDILKKAYDPESFRQMGHELIDFMADHLASTQEGNGKAIPFSSPDDSWRKWSGDLESSDVFPLDLLQHTIKEGVQLHHPQYMGHQISPPTPLSALAGLVNDFMNNGMGVYEMGTVAVTLERLVCQIAAQKLGFTPQAGGVLTSGGTLANLTALLAARKSKASHNVWREGQQKPLALLVSEQAHYCVDRAVRIMGWGEEGIIKVPVDENLSIRVDLLPHYLEKAKSNHLEVIAVVGSACSTATGSFDDLNGLADFCQANDLWLHIDGAHGAATAFSEKYKYLVSGIHRADSVAMDLHKMLITPALATTLIYKNSYDSYRTFAQEAAYLWEQSEEHEWYNLAKRTFECTKAMYSLKFYSTYRAYGPDLFDAYVTRVIDTTKAFAHQIKTQQEFELAVEPACNIICFRYVGQPSSRLSLSEQNQINGNIRKVLLDDGHFYVVQTQLQGKVFLRCTLTNPFTEPKHTQELLHTIEQVFAEAQP